MITPVTNHAHSETQWWQHSAMGMFLYSREKEAGPSFLKEKKSNLVRRVTVFGKRKYTQLFEANPKVYERL